MFEWLRKLFKPKDDGLKLVGHEVRVNPVTRAEVRNAARMARLRQAIPEIKSSKRRTAMQKELLQRERR